MLTVMVGSINLLRSFILLQRGRCEEVEATDAGVTNQALTPAQYTQDPRSKNPHSSGPRDYDFDEAVWPAWQEAYRQGGRKTIQGRLELTVKCVELQFS